MWFVALVLPPLITALLVLNTYLWLESRSSARRPPRQPPRPLVEPVVVAPRSRRLTPSWEQGR